MSKQHEYVEMMRNGSMQHITCWHDYTVFVRMTSTGLFLTKKKCRDNKIYVKK